MQRNRMTKKNAKQKWFFTLLMVLTLALLGAIFFTFYGKSTNHSNSSEVRATSSSSKQSNERSNSSEITRSQETETSLPSSSTSSLNNSVTMNSENTQAANSQTPEEAQAHADIYDRLVAARDAAMEHAKQRVAEGGSQNDVQSPMSAVIFESEVLKREYPQYSDYIEQTVKQLGY